MLPEMPLQAISRFSTNDACMYTWDLARATGQDDRFDEDRCRVLYEGMLPLDDVLRQSGQCGPALHARPPAHEAFTAFPPSTRRNVLRWIASARTEATRSRRIAATADEAAQGRRVKSNG
jgi:hypothetical protein